MSHADFFSYRFPPFMHVLCAHVTYTSRG